MFPTYHIYPPTAPHVAYMQPKANAPSFFMADELRQVFFTGPLTLFLNIFPVFMSDEMHPCCPLGADKQTSDHHGPDRPLRKPR